MGSDFKTCYSHSHEYPDPINSQYIGPKKMNKPKIKQNEKNTDKNENEKKISNENKNKNENIRDILLDNESKQEQAYNIYLFNLLNKDSIINWIKNNSKKGCNYYYKTLPNYLKYPNKKWYNPFSKYFYTDLDIWKNKYIKINFKEKFCKKYGFELNDLKIYIKFDNVHNVKYLYFEWKFPIKQNHLQEKINNKDMQVPIEYL
tara:strand:+ start:2066 stop:2674 length:609 start_codon:yes stop_codon:yes gene_type:complete